MDIADLCLPDCLIGLMRNNAWLIVRSKRYSCKYIDRRTGLQEIRNHFGKGLVSFFNTDLTEYAPEAKDNAEAPEWSFCYEEKAYLMIIIDSTQDIAEREGLRAAYEILCHSDS